MNRINKGLKFLVIILLSTFSFSQNYSKEILKNIEAIKPYNDSVTDLTFLDSIALNNKIIWLGTEDGYHGTSKTIQTQIISYLSEKHGYSIVLDEKTILTDELIKYLKSINDKRELLSCDNLHHSKQWIELCKTLWSLKQSKKIDFYGLDIGDATGDCIQGMMDLFEKYFKRLGKDSTFFLSCFRSTTNSNLFKCDSLIGLQKLYSSICNYKLIETNKSNILKEKIILLRYFKEFAEYRLKQCDYIKSQISSKKTELNYWNFHDSIISENVNYFLDSVAKERKTIIITQNYQLMRNLKSNDKLNALSRNALPAYERIYKDRKDSMFTLAFVDSYEITRVGIKKKIKQKRKFKNSLENEFARTHLDYGFINFQKIRGKGLSTQFYFRPTVISYCKANWLSVFDGVFLIRNMVIAN